MQRHLNLNLRRAFLLAGFLVLVGRRRVALAAPRAGGDG